MMSNQVRKWFPVLFFLLLAVLSYWLENKVRLSALKQETMGHVPDVIVEGIEATKFGLDGKPHQSLTADELMHYADDNSAKLVAPRLLLSSPDQADWHVSSKWAQLSDNMKDIYLHEDVQVVRSAFGKHSKMDMTTDYLHLDPDGHMGDTNMPVRIRDAQTDIHAVGMAFNNETGVVKLLSHVHVTYEK